MKKGLEQFIRREISHLQQTNAEISLYPTKIGPGLYEPDASWKVYRWTKLAVLIGQLSVFLSKPARYLKALGIAMKTNAVADFLLAAYFSKSMRDLDGIYCTFGDRKLFVGYFAKLLTDKPLLCTVHAYELYQNPNLKLFPMALAACDQVITISEYNRRKLSEIYHLDPAKIEIITYSIDLNDYRPAKKFRILIVGFFVERKGHRFLFEAVKKLDDPEIEIWVVGGEGAEDDSVDVRKIAHELKIESQVAFLGKQSGTALRAMYHACDLFCLPCHFDSVGVGEGFPNVIIEAMACGKPVIATKHVGIPEILKQITVDEKDSGQLADAIEKIKSSPELQKQLGDQNRRLAQQHFDPSNVQRTAELIRTFSSK
ncbi:MAG: glycosyltransferase family 4 protein [Planctomycetota bacterium]